MVVFLKFGLRDHIDGTVDTRLHLHDAEWTQIDYCIISWPYTTISSEILDIVLKPDDTVYSLWLAIHNLFLGNQNDRTVYALQEFHNVYHGDTSIT